VPYGWTCFLNNHEALPIFLSEVFMGIKEDYIEKIDKQVKSVFYKFPKKQGFFKKREEMKFIIKPIFAIDLFTSEIKEKVYKELSNGQTYEEASRIVAENFKKEILSLNSDSFCKVFFEKGVVFPKIVEKEKDLKDDELPFKLLTLDIKIFLMQELMKISPIFER
jgi:hypothetical protein